MIRRDYILRMVEAAGAALARILLRQQAGEIQLALSDVRLTANELLGLDERALASLTDTQLAQILTGGGRLHRECCAVAAMLLKTEADLLDQAGDPDAAQRQRVKALSLFLEVTVNEVHVSGIDCATEIAVTSRQLAGTCLPAHIEVKLLRHHELRGEFALAETVLFRLAETCGSQVFEAGCAFYGRLRAKDDDALARGDLPRAEVEAGFEEFRRIHQSSPVHD